MAPWNASWLGREQLPMTPEQMLNSPRGLRASRDDWRLEAAILALAAARDFACAICSTLSASARLGDELNGGEGIKSRLKLIIAVCVGCPGGL